MVTTISLRMTTWMSPKAIVTATSHNCRKLHPLLAIHPAHPTHLLRPIISGSFSAVGSIPSIPSCPSIPQATANPSPDPPNPLFAPAPSCCPSLHLLAKPPHTIPEEAPFPPFLSAGTIRSFSSVNGAARGGKGQRQYQESRENRNQQRRAEGQQQQQQREHRQQQDQQQQGEQRRLEGESHMVAVRGAFRQLAEPLQWVLRGAAFFVPTRIQEEGIPRLLKGESLFLSSPSGSGKTLAYLLPVLHLLHLPSVSSPLFSPPHVPSSRLRHHRKETRGKERSTANSNAPPGSGADVRGGGIDAAAGASGPFCLVLTPTMELANQVAEEVRQFTRSIPELKVEVVTAAGSGHTVSQVRSLYRRSPDVLVATPGRLLRLFQQAASEKHPPLGPLTLTRTPIAAETASTETVETTPSESVSCGDETRSRAVETAESSKELGLPESSRALELPPDAGKLSGKDALGSLPKDFLGQVRHWVVEECDKMAEMGLLEDLRKVFSLLPRPQKAKAGTRRDQRPHMQVVLVSATIHPESELLLRRFAPKGDMLIVQPSTSDKPSVKQLAYRVHPRRKTALLLYLLRRRASLRTHQVLVFARTVLRAQRLHQALTEGGITAALLHGDLTGAARRHALEAFKQGTVQVLVATNVAARGVDIPNLPFVVNFDLPGSPQEYLHRIGRTGRAGAAGTAISFVGTLETLESETSEGGHTKEPNQLAEMPDWMEAAQKLLGQRIEFRKVPGPWRDEPAGDS
ncbi:hypothetical protein CLOP_g17104 [Closterium sp. NIES-67]|nr:hypothetical protein CLOP_g17104 [Closterium sp. NIES-67]